MKTLSAIPIKTPYIDQILNGEKTWEIRSKNTKKLGQVALIKSGSGTVVATAFISETILLDYQTAEKNAHLIGISKSEALHCSGYYAWVLKDIVKLETPVPYKHPNGAVTWVTLRDETVDNVLAEMKKSSPVKKAKTKPKEIKPKTKPKVKKTNNDWSGARRHFK